jgi:hypothetical protein
MNNRYRLLVALVMIAASGMAAAVPPSGTGGGYFGTAWFTNGQGIVVGPYSTWWECDQAFQDALDYNVNVRGWTIETMNPCSYNPPFPIAAPNHELSFDIDDSDPDTSLDDAQRIIEKVRRLRETYMIDEYEAELRRMK